MSTSKKISFYNLREEACNARIPRLIGRHEELKRLTRLIGRRTNNNALIIGESGRGKTAFIQGWMQRMSTSHTYTQYTLVQLDSDHLYTLETIPELEKYYSTALCNIPAPSIVFVDDFGKEVYKNIALMRRIHQLYDTLIKRRDVHLILAMQPHEHAWIEKEYPLFLNTFDTLVLKQQTSAEYERILFTKVPALNTQRKIIIPEKPLQKIVTLTKRHPTLGNIPRSSIHILDECISHCFSQNKKVLAENAVDEVVASKTGIPHTALGKDDLSHIQSLHTELTKRVIGQDHALATIASILQRAKLGLRSKSRPLGSFLMLGPSGVGKTETAKSVAELLFGNAESFTRIDMSEFQQEHTVQRLIGAPPGYIGYEEGGFLTNALKREPHSLILLDEIEKAHPKVFDVFLQVLDDGRLTSGKGETVDARDAVVMATSNTAVTEILAAQERQDTESDEVFIQETILPILAQTFRLEFINRFDAILLFRPLTVSGLMEIAQLEIKKAEDRFKEHHVRFSLDAETLEKHIRQIQDPRFGARPIKRFIEDTCETMIADSLLK